MPEEYDDTARYYEEPIPEVLEGYELRVHQSGDYMMAGLHLSIVDGEESGRHKVIDFSVGGAPAGDTLQVIEYDGTEVVSTRDATESEALRLYTAVNSGDKRLDSREEVFASKIILRKIIESELFSKVGENGKHEYFKLLHDALYDETDVTRSDCKVINREGVVDPNTAAYQEIVSRVLTRYVDPQKASESELLDHYLRGHDADNALLESLLIEKIG